MTSPAPIHTMPAPAPQRLGRNTASPLGRLLRWVILAAVVVGLALLAWWLSSSMGAASTASIPTATVQRGSVMLQVYAEGTLKGGNSELLVGPSISNGQLTISYLLDAGTQVQKGDEVVGFDTGTAEYNLTQAEEALQQAQQQVIQAQSSTAAQTEQDSYDLLQAQYNVQLAKLQVQQNPILAKVDAETNNLNLAAAQARLKQLQADIANRKASSAATIAVQQAAEKQAQADAESAKLDIAAMTLRAQNSGYVAVDLNQGFARGFAGQSAQDFQIGDTVRHGQTVAEIPDTSTWAVDLLVNELDAGHLAPGEPAQIRFVALPGRVFQGQVETLGQAQGPVWNRQVECIVKLLNPSPELRPGFTANAVITTDVLKNVLHAPAQVVFDQGGSVAFRKHNGTFERIPVTVVQRSESQVVLQGVAAGDVLALANPQNRGTAGGGGAGGPGASRGRGARGGRGNNAPGQAEPGQGGGRRGGRGGGRRGAAPAGPGGGGQ
ncbi:MAG TPA: HlyD family efflux transporter periplasmic adaptor subunit [Terriglobales bacterium]|nr:HlyD family efflux transporter periplasmic adaptor subunit [Terriglobales bacterium]